MSVIIRPEYSSDEYSDLDEYDFDYIPCKKSNYSSTPAQKDYKSQLYDLTLYGTYEEFVNLLQNNSNKFDFDYDGWTLLMTAASHGQYEKMKYLLELGADPNYNYNMFTALIAVCDSSKSEEDLYKCIQVLEKFNPNFNVEDRHGVTPLMYASKHGYMKIVKYLLEKCPDCVNRTDSESFSALFYAVIHNHVDVVELLLEAKAAPNMIDIHGRTVLEIAILKQYNDIIEILHPGYLQQQDEDMMAMNQTKSNQIIYDYITLFKNNLPHPSAIKSTGFYTNVIEMLNACELLDFSSDIIEKQMSLFQFTNINSDTLKEHNIHLNYQRNEILNAIKVFHLHKWKLARSVMNKTNKKKIKLDELIYYTYLICEQMYVDYSALNYIENQKFKIKDLAEKCSDNMNYAKTLMRLSVILNKYERYVENVILKDNCLHPAGFIEDINSSKSLKWIVGCVVPALGFTVLYGYFKK